MILQTMLKWSFKDMEIRSLDGSLSMNPLCSGKFLPGFQVSEADKNSDNYPLPDNYFTNTSIPKQQQPYWCGHHVLLAHAKAYHLARSLGINGTISFKTNGGFKIPLTNSSEDALAVQRAWDFNEGWFANPTFINGDYPQYLKEYVSGFLPAFTAEEIEMINGTADIFAHDAYTSQFYMGQ
jgi:beta-glucosidase/6-phospho-beta-glucosidase/beta-galactosidase